MRYISEMLGAVGFTGIIVANIIGSRFDVVAVGIVGLCWVAIAFLWHLMAKA